MAAKKTAAKKTTARPARDPKPRAASDEACLYCGRPAVARLKAKGAAVCEHHKARAEAVEQETEKL